MSTEQMIPFNKPHFFPEEFQSAMNEATTARKFSGDGINSKHCYKFFKERYGYERSLLTPSCTAALEMAALLLQLGPGDEVIVPSFTFVSTANAFALRGVNIIFADSESESPNVCVSDIIKKVTPKTKAIVVVHYAGVVVDVPRIIKETNAQIPVVEDCAHAIDSVDPNTGNFVGKSGCLSTFSFHETKNVAIGEGGLLVVNDEKLWKNAQIIREKGTNRTEFKEGNVPFYTWVSLGSSYLMSDIDAAMLWSALQNINHIQRRRLEIWDAYDHKLTLNSLFFKPMKESQRANAHMYYLRFVKPEMVDVFCKAMKERGIIVSKHYVPLHLSPAALRIQADYQTKTPCPQSTTWSQTLVRLPLFYDLDDDQLSHVITSVNNFTFENGILMEDATEEHWDDIRNIRNKNSEFFGNSEQITKERHWDFMRKNHMTYWVATLKGKCVGFIGHVGKDFRIGTSKKRFGIAKFLVDAWIHVNGHDFQYFVLRSNPRVFAFGYAVGYAPSTKSWEAGEDPVKLLRMCKNEGKYIDVRSSLGIPIRSKL